MRTTPLASSQTTVMSERLFKWGDYLIFAMLTVASLFSLAYFLAYWFSLRDWMYYPIPFTIMTLGFLLNISLFQMRWLTLPCMRRPCPMTARPGWKVGAATTF